MTSYKNDHVCLRDLGDLTVHIIFDGWWDSMNIVFIDPIAWHHSRHASAWRGYLHSGITETGSTGIISNVGHRILGHPSEHGTSWTGKHLVAKVNFTKLNKLIELKVTKLTTSTVDETALAIMKGQGSRWIIRVSWRMTIIFAIRVNPYELK